MVSIENYFLKIFYDIYYAHEKLIIIIIFFNIGRPGDIKIGFIVIFIIIMATGVHHIISSLASILGKLLSWSHVIGIGVLLAPLVIPVAEKILVRKYWDIST